MSITQKEAPATPMPDPVQEALSALVGATEALKRLADEYLEAAQVAALSGRTVPVPLRNQMSQARDAHCDAAFDLHVAVGNACPKAVAPVWEWARLDELQPGDRIHWGASLPEGARWHEVTNTDVVGRSGAFGSRITVWVKEQVPPVLSMDPGRNVRRQTTSPAEAEATSRSEVADAVLGGAA